MTVDELRKMWADGNKEAAMLLGEHYVEEKNYTAAVYYYEEAAKEEDNWEAAYNAMLAARICGCEHMGDRDYRMATTYFSSAIRWAEKLSEGKLAQQVDVQYKRNVCDTLTGSIYLYCLASYVQEKSDAVLKMLPTPRETKTRLLRGVALQRAAITLDDYREAFDFQTVIEDRTFKPVFWEEQVFLCEAAVNMAAFYQTGLDGRAAKDLSRSVDILKSAIDRVSHPQCKSALQEELSKYRPRFFGGYTYVG